MIGQNRRIGDTVQSANGDGRSRLGVSKDKTAGNALANNYACRIFVVISAHDQGILTIIGDLYVALPLRGRLKIAPLVVELMLWAGLQSEKFRTRFGDTGGKRMLVGAT